jgi:branched-chain amino acid transport system permease protein
MIGAVLLGVLEVTLISMAGAGLAPVFVFVVMLVFLLIRPRGISGIIVQEKA